MTGSILLPLYRAASAGFGPLAPLYLLWRANFGREVRGRLGERLGRAGPPRPDGKLVWLHCAGAADVQALRPLVEKLEAVGFNVLATTRATRSGSPARPRPSPKTLHQFAPFDVPAFLRRFLDHWRPDMVLLGQSEFWPNLILETSRRGIPLALVDARLSARAFLLWRKLPGLVGALLGRIDPCLARTEADALRFAKLGAARALATGDVRCDAAPPPVDAAALASFAARLGARPAWAAVSTDPDEDGIALEVHRRVARHFPDLVTLIAPRRAERGLEIARRAGKLGVTAGFLRGGREDGALPEIVVAESIGEAGLYYRAASVAFLGKSLGKSPGESLHGGGINPIEAAKLGCAILHGPDVGDFEDIYAELDGAGGAGRVSDAETLAAELALLLFDAAELRAMARAGAETVERLGGASAGIMRALAPSIARATAPPRRFDG